MLRFSIFVAICLFPLTMFAGNTGARADQGPPQYPTHGGDFDGDGFTIAQGDCNDLDANEFPGQTWYKDLDDDGFSDGVTQVTCPRPVSHKTQEELTRTAGDIDDLVRDPSVTTPPVIQTLEPSLLVQNRQLVIRGSSFGEFQGSAYLRFFQNNRSATILSWNDNEIVYMISPTVRNGCVEVLTVMGTSNCVSYSISRPVQWLLLRK